MPSKVSNNLCFRACRIALYGKFHLYCLYHFRYFSGLYTVRIWFINYTLHFGCVKIHKHCLYWCAFSTDINRKMVFIGLLLFKLFLLVSKLYELVSKLCVFFLTCSETESRCISDCFQYRYIQEVQFQLCSNVLLFLSFSL